MNPTIARALIDAAEDAGLMIVDGGRNGLQVIALGEDFDPGLDKYVQAMKQHGREIRAEMLRHVRPRHEPEVMLSRNCRI